MTVVGHVMMAIRRVRLFTQRYLLRDCDSRNGEECSDAEREALIQVNLYCHLKLSCELYTLQNLQ